MRVVTIHIEYNPREGLVYTEPTPGVSDMFRMDREQAARMKDSVEQIRGVETCAVNAHHGVLVNISPESSWHELEDQVRQVVVQHARHSGHTVVDSVSFSRSQDDLVERFPGYRLSVV